MLNRRSFLQAAAVVAAPAVVPMTAQSSRAVDFVKPVAEAAGLTAYLKDDSLQIRYDNLPLVAYRAQPSLKYPYFCPLNGPASGLSLTTESSLPYPHHRGLWLGCDPLNGGNYWADNGLESGQIRSTELVLDEANLGKLSAGNTVGFTQKCEWRREGSNPFNDARRYAVTRADDRLTFIDCTFKLTAGEDVSIIGAKHSFFALRAASDISPAYGGSLVTSHGATDVVGSYGKPADWCGYYGKRRMRPDVTEGIVIMSHPENFGGNCPWFIRDYGHLSPSPFNFNKEPWTLAKDKTLDLRYRVVLFAGEPQSVGLNDVFRLGVSEVELFASAARRRYNAAMLKLQTRKTHQSSEPDEARALDLVLRLMAVPGGSGDEGRVVELITSELRRAGAKARDIEIDDAPKPSPVAGKVGNLVFKLPGTIDGPRRLLMAHMDTVPLCIGSKPKRKGAYVQSADRTTGLGADDRAGCAVVLTAALEILRKKLPHPPLTFFWPVQEEIGLFGAHYGDLALLGKPKLAFNWDGGAAEKLTIGATGAYRMQITVGGVASHAGGAPERGVSAVTIASSAVADLHKNGWLGLVQKDGVRGTSNVGVVRGGAATNVITDRVELKAECRGHDRKFRKRILNEICAAFQRAAAAVRNSDGAGGTVKVEHRLDYESFQLHDDEPCVVEAERAVAAAGLAPIRAVSNGGLDANWLSARGIPTVTLGCGQMDVHTVKERLDIKAFRAACRIGLRLATAS